MNRDIAIIILGWIITIILLIFFIPKNKIREAIIPFFFKLALTWITSLAVVELRLIEYPVRFFSYANRTSFSFEYFIYPSFCSLFNIHYPERKSFFKQFMYYFYWCSILTAIEIRVEKYTDILEYLHWSWHITWLTFLITFYLSRQFYLWFFKKVKIQE